MNFEWTELEEEMVYKTAQLYPEYGQVLKCFGDSLIVADADAPAGIRFLYPFETDSPLAYSFTSLCECNDRVQHEIKGALKYNDAHVFDIEEELNSYFTKESVADLPPRYWMEFNTEARNIIRKILETAKEFFRPDGICTGGCTPFYSQRQWRERGEKYGLSSRLIIVYDGGDLASFFSSSNGVGSAYDRMILAMGGINYFVEEATGWYATVHDV